MQTFQIILICFSILNILFLAKAYKECKKGSAYGLTPFLHPLGMYVWGDVLIFSIFWIVVAFSCVLLSDLYLFYLTVSLFWVVRSLGETIYWMIQQFSTVKREPPEKVELYSFFKNDSVWFINQIRNQCITVIALVASIYFGALWVNVRF